MQTHRLVRANYGDGHEMPAWTSKILFKFTRIWASSRQRHATFDMKQQEAAQFGVAAVTEYAKTVKATSSKTAYLG